MIVKSAWEIKGGGGQKERQRERNREIRNLRARVKNIYRERGGRGRER